MAVCKSDRGKDRQVTPIRNAVREGHLKALGIFRVLSLPPEEAIAFCDQRFGVRPKLDRCGGQAPNLYVVKAEEEQLWPGAWWRRANEMLGTDMSGIERETSEGWLQFHSLQHTMVTNVTGNTKSEALGMEICRISSPELLRRYYHPSQSDRQQAVESLPMPKITVR